MREKEIASKSFIFRAGLVFCLFAGMYAARQESMQCKFALGGDLQFVHIALLLSEKKPLAQKDE